MRILVATPLYPPDPTETSQYVKELALRLSKKNKVTVLLYGYLPEEIENVHTICIDKRKAIIIRLFYFFRTLTTEMKRNDIMYIINGRSVEIPTFFGILMYKIPHIFLPIDKNPSWNIFSKHLSKRSQKCINFTDTQLTRPEILPNQDYPETQMLKYEQNWDNHLKKIYE